MALIGNITQVATEVALAASVAAARITQVATEALFRDRKAEIRITQVAAEVALRSTPPSGASRITQVALEVLHLPQPAVSAKATQVALEVLHLPQTPSGGTQTPPTFDLCAEFPFIRVSVRTAAKNDDEMGVRRARQIPPRQIRVFTLTWNSMQYQIIDLVEYFWHLVKGPVLPMFFTPPGELQCLVRFKENTLSKLKESANSGSCTIELEEVC